MSPEPNRADGATERSVWRNSYWLAREAGGIGWNVPVMVAVGLLAALAEVLGVSLAVVFLFALLGDVQQAMASDGLLARLFALLMPVTGNSLGRLAAIIILFIMASAALLYLYAVMAAQFTNTVADRMRRRVHQRYVTVAYPWIQARDPGALLDTLATQTWSVADGLYAITRMAVNLCAVAVLGAAMLLLSWQIGLTAALLAAALFLMLRLVGIPVRRLSTRTLAANRTLAERMLVSLNGMRTLRVFGQEAFVLRLFGNSSTEVKQLAVATERWKAMIHPLAEMGGLATLLAIALVARAAGIDVATTLAAALFLFRLQPHLREFENNRLVLASMSAPMRAVREVMDPEGKPVQRDGSRPFTALQQQIRFDAVGFSHDPRRGPSLEQVSFSIPAGRTTLLSGPSGAGKTTIINLLLRLYEPDSGRILVDGTPLGDLTRDAWLGRVAIAGQDVELVEGTVAQNVRLARHDATVDEVREALGAAGILGEIDAQPDGIHARIGPGGLSFSGGQRQRIGLARALLRDPDILILDEAMSAVEPALEQELTSRITERMAGRTLLVISHREDAMLRAQHVVQIRGGKVVCEGPPDRGAGLNPGTSARSGDQDCPSPGAA